MSQSEILPIHSIGNLVEIAREINRGHRKDLHDNRLDVYMSMSPESYAQQYKTVRVDVGRQIGKTTYMARTAVAGDIVVVGKASLAKMLTSNFDVQAHVLSINVIDQYPQQTLGMHHTVWVDDASYISKEKLDMMYNMFGARASQFVLLG